MGKTTLFGDIKQISGCLGPELGLELTVKEQ